MANTAAAETTAAAAAAETTTAAMRTYLHPIKLLHLRYSRPTDDGKHLF